MASKDKINPAAAFVGLLIPLLSRNVLTVVSSDYIVYFATVTARSSLKKQSLISVEVTRTKIHLNYGRETSQ